MNEILRRRVSCLTDHTDYESIMNCKQLHNRQTTFFFEKMTCAEFADLSAVKRQRPGEQVMARTVPFNPSADEIFQKFRRQVAVNERRLATVST